MDLVQRLKQKVTTEPPPVDITENLQTLQFESALTEEEKALLHLRYRSHALTVTACAQATYFTVVLNEARQLRRQIKSPQKKTAKILQDREPKDQVKVGILGCGRLGSQLAHCLLTYGGVRPKDLKVSTRRPETLEYLQSKGVDCFYDNIKLISTSHIVYICVLPSQIPSIAEELKHNIPPTVIFYSLVSTYTTKKLKQLLLTSNIIHPEFTWRDDSHTNTWDCTLNVNAALENPDTVEMTCPIGFKKSESIICTNEKFAEQMLFAFMNWCTQLQLTKVETLDVIHSVLFQDLMEDKLKEEDFIKRKDNLAGMFPRFDLVKVFQVKTPVQRKLVEDEHLRKTFVQKYLSVFDTYIKQRAQALLSGIADN